MTHKERIIAALEHRQPDYTPYSLGFTAQAYERMTAFGAKDRIDSIESPITGVYYSGFPTEIPGKPGYFIDDFGCIWNRNGIDKEIGVIDSPTIKEPNLSAWREPVIPEAKLRERCQRCIDNKGDRFTRFDYGFSLYERFWAYCGIEDALYYLAAEPEFANELLDRICGYNLKIIDLALEYPFDAIQFGDDWGQQKGLVMGAARWREMIKPRLAKMYKRVKDAGRFIIQHSCGDITDIFPDLIELGLDCYQTFQSDVYDVAAIKAKFGDKLSFYGGISTQSILPFGTPEAVRAETRRLIDILGVNGGYIAGPTHALTHDIPPENILAMLDVFEKEARNR